MFNSVNLGFQKEPIYFYWGRTDIGNFDCKSFLERVLKKQILTTECLTTTYLMSETETLMPEALFGKSLRKKIFRQ